MSAAPASQWFATCPKGLESLLAAELSALGASATRETVAGVHFDGPLALAYRACLWSRLASRILRPVASFEVRDADSLYRQLRSVDWGALFSPQSSFAIDFSGCNEHIRNTQFGAQRSKDAVVDWFAARQGQRPDVDRHSPDVRLNLRLVKTQLHLALDFSGRSLHQRGYRLRGGTAPLKENLAAALLLRADWPAIAARGGALIDPMCGSATLLLEAAMMAADSAPGLARTRFGFECLHGHNARQWQAIVSEARARAERGRRGPLPDIRGYDADPAVVRVAQENVARLGLQKVVRVSCRPVAQLQKPSHKPLPFGLLMCNPPYGERLGEKRALRCVYRQLGAAMQREFAGWQAAIFTSDLDLGRATGLRSHRRYALFNGSIASSLLLFDLTDNQLRGPECADERVRKTDEPRARAAAVDSPWRQPAAAGPGPEAAVPSPAPAALTKQNAAAATRQSTQPSATRLAAGAQMFANRIVKNRRRLAAWVRREQISCYRLYDADMPEYAVAVDLYHGDLQGAPDRVDRNRGCQVHVAEYRAPRGVAPQAAARRLDEVRAALPAALGVPASGIVYKQRRRQRGEQQYQKRSSRGELLSVREGAARLLVNLHDYPDTGLFLDHRPLRLRIGREARGRDFLNLFCYTGAATVHAALGGARSTTSVDMSNTYLDWLRRNLAHNDLDESCHQRVRANCLEWLAAQQSSPPGYDLILLDPPSFSNSSKMQDSFDVQRDHAGLVRAAMGVLRQAGRLYFSSNLRSFRLDPALEQEYHCEDITERTLDPDFRRHRRIHRCWSMRHWSKG